MTEARELKINSQLIGNKAYMLLNAQIGYDAEQPMESYINGSSFAQRIYDLKAQGYSVVVKINSPGGNVFDGYSIIDAIKTTNADTHNIGIAASMAGHILLSGVKRKADEGTTMMIHAVSGGSPKVREILGAGLQDLLDKRTRLAKDKITEMMTGSGMHWFDASEMETHGMVDEVVPTEAKYYKPATKNVMELFKVYNSQTQNDQDTMEIKELLKGIWPGKTDAEVVTNALALKNENDGLKVKNQALEAQVTALNATIAESGKVAKQLEVKNLIDEAVKNGKIKEESRGSWEAMATADMKAAKETLDSIVKIKNSSAAATIKNDAPEVTAEKETYAWLTKNNPKKLLEIMNSTPEKFDELLTAYEESLNVK